MSLINIFKKELEKEGNTTRKMLGRIPDDQYDFQPHKRSMNMRSLATHIAELPGWIVLTFNTDELDFETSPYNPVSISNTKELLTYFEKTLAEGLAALDTATEDQLEQIWVLRSGTHILASQTKAEMIRVCLNQIVHHRAQIGVFLRLLDIPIPGSYGPSADEH